MRSFGRPALRGVCVKNVLDEYDAVFEMEVGPRQFNAVYIQLEGKIKSLIELKSLHLVELKDKIKSLEKYIVTNTVKRELLREKLVKLEKRVPFTIKFRKAVKGYRNIKFKLHQKKRKLASCKIKLASLEEDVRNGTLRICFGSKVLFKKQFELEANGYLSLTEWKVDWINARSSQFFCIGSKDETAGNQTCTYTANGTLRLRVADEFVKDYETYLVFKDVTFAYGQEVINDALHTYIGTTKGGKPAKYVNSSISYRFSKNKRGWYIYATVDKVLPDIVTSLSLGSIGVDMNAGFVSLCDVDRFGNPLREESITLLMYNRSTNQITASIGDVVKTIVCKALQSGKPIVIEKLDFSKKKSMLGEQSREYSRMLSGFAYSKFKEMLKARASKFGVAVIEVNPAFTSLIGQIKFMKRYGLSSHGSAACVIARRGLGIKIEKPKYDSILGRFEKTNHHKPLRSRWSTIAYLVKKNHRFNDRIELLKLDA